MGASGMIVVCAASAAAWLIGFMIGRWTCPACKDRMRWNRKRAAKIDLKCGGDPNKALDMMRNVTTLEDGPMGSPESRQRLSRMAERLGI